MGFKCGLLGLPNVGKTTLFTALTGAKVETAQQHHKDSNLVTVQVPDSRLDRIAELIPPQKLTPATVEFIDLPGILQSASKETSKNTFLNNIRESEALVQVVRCFEDPNVFHIHETVDPLRDVEMVNLELALTDLDVCSKRLVTVDKSVRTGRKDLELLKVTLEKCVATLEQGKPLRFLDLKENELAVLREMRLLTLKKMLYVANVSEAEMNQGNAHTKKLEKLAEQEKTPMISVCAKLEAELAQMSHEERQEFMKELQIQESSLAKLIRAGYQLLGLKTYFTAGRKEVRAWTFPAGAKAPKAAAVIHTDFEKGFIRAEIYHCEELFALKSEKAIKEAGKIRMEGKNYEVQDGDVILFHFN